MKSDNIFIIVFVLLSMIFIPSTSSMSDEIGKNGIKNQETDIEKIYLLGNTYAEAGLLDEAIDKYKEVLELDNTFKDTHYKLGFIYLFKSDYTSALKEFKKEREVNPRNLEVYDGLRIVYEKENRISEGIKELRKALEETSVPEERYYIQGFIYYLDKDYEKSLIEFEKALSCNQYLPILMGEICEKINDKDRAIYYYKKFIEESPSDKFNALKEELKERIGKLETQ